MQQLIERYEKRLIQEKDEFLKTLCERIARIQQEIKSGKKSEKKRKQMKNLEKNIQYASSQHEKEQAVQMKKQENLERLQKELIKNLELDNVKLREQNEQLSEALFKGELRIREEMEEQKIKFYKADRNYSDMQTEFEKEKSYVPTKKLSSQKRKSSYLKKDKDDAYQLSSKLSTNFKETRKIRRISTSRPIMQIASLEQKCEQEIRDTVEKYQAQIQKLQCPIHKLEKEKKLLHKKLEIIHISNDCSSSSSFKTGN